MFDRNRYMRDYMRKRRGSKLAGPPDPATDNPWRKVVFEAECVDGACPHCHTSFTECGCPGPAMDGMDYRWIRGVLCARLSIGA